jgi:adenine-specific DNA-methyltransferase
MMEKIDKGHPMSQSADFVAHNIETLKSLFPTIVKEGKIDIKELQALLGAEVETEDEYYRFTWAGKSMARREANKPSTATLRPDKAGSKDWDTTQNIFIEGDNLEVLKLLQKSYANKIKMIYIDPPYNTGKDFVYKDNYNDNLGNYLAITGQVDHEGKRINTNSESDGRYHSNWLNMMYPRLKLARNLLKEDGVIFISIDDSEAINLKKLCDELFGEENFIAQVVVEGTPKNDPYIISTAHEYCFVYTKKIESAKSANYGIINPLYKTISQIYERNKKDPVKVVDELRKFYSENNLDNDNISNYKFCDSFGVFRTGPIDDPQSSGSKDNRINPITGNPCKIPSRGWSCNIDTWNDWQSKNLIWFPDTDEVLPAKKTYISEDRLDILRAYFKIQTRKDTDNLKRMFGTSFTVFSNPKPLDLIKSIISINQDKNDIILDFFAGSGTTAHALMDLNKDGKNRSFILVQLPEKLNISSASSNKDKKIIETAISFLDSINKPHSISEITKERIRRAGEKIKSEIKDDLFSKKGKTLDVGFRAFKLDSSNIRAWDGNPDALEDNLFNAGSNIKENRSEEDVLYEILLKYGLDLTMLIEQKEIAGKEVFNIGMGALFICLGDNITTAVAEGIGKWKEEQKPATTKVIFKDTGFTDVEKTNSMQILKRFNIIEINTI